MEKHEKILQYLIDNPDLRAVSDQTNDVDVSIFEELIAAGLVKGINACADDGRCYLEPRISMQGREWLNASRTTTDNTGVTYNFNSPIENVQTGDSSSLTNIKSSETKKLSIFSWLVDKVVVVIFTTLVGGVGLLYLSDWLDIGGK